MDFSQFRNLPCCLFNSYARTVPNVQNIFFLWPNFIFHKNYLIYKEAIDRFDHVQVQSMQSYHTQSKPKKSHRPKITIFLSMITTDLLTIMSNTTENIKKFISFFSILINYEHIFPTYVLTFEKIRNFKKYFIIDHLSNMKKIKH